LKAASIQDIWRKLRKSKNRRLSGLVFGWRGVRRLSDGVLVVARPLTVICGENGVGKTTILHSLFQALTKPERRLEATPSLRAESGEIAELTLNLVDSQGARSDLAGFEAVRGYTCPEETTRIALVDPAMQIPTILSLIKRDANFSEILEPLSPKEFDPDDVSGASFVIGRDYQRIEAFEIDGIGDFGVFPYFRVQVGGSVYGSEDMGQGEHSVLLIMWMLARLPADAIGLLEEPETYIAPRSQRALIDVVARYAERKRLLVVATSHSAKVIERLERDEIVLVSRAQGQVTIHVPPPIETLKHRLEIFDRTQAIFLVEDEIASLFAAALVQYSTRLCTCSHFGIAGDAGRVRKALNVIPDIRKGRIRVIGLLDGDQHSDDDDGNQKIKFLPGDEGPEALLRTYALGGSFGDFANAMGVDEANLRLALAGCEGMDAHDWIHELARGLAYSLQDVVSRLTRMWASGNADAFEAKLTDLEQAIQF